ncbi:MAG: hypothetical protein IVW55_15825 [Chloroflexi bacterium]|nr:hypothetical protein [Chloroflexota bacterium]
MTNSRRTLAERKGYTNGMSLLKRTGILLIFGYVLYFLLIYSQALWVSPTLVQDRWSGAFSPLAELFPTWWVRPDRGSDLGYIASALFIIVLAFVTAPYILALAGSFRLGAFRAQDSTPAFRWIFFVSVAVLALLFIVPGILSTDLFSYIWYGRILVVFGESPFTHVPADYIFRDQGNWLQWVYWKETPVVYGPVWVAFAGLIASVAQAIDGDIVTHLLGYKLLADLAYLVNLALIWKIAGIVVPRYWNQPRALPQSASLADWQTGARVGVTVVYAWNPLMLLEFGANGHNDILMITGILCAMWLHLSGRWRLAMVAFGLAALVKFIALAFVPGYLWLLFWEASPGKAHDNLPRRVGYLLQASALLVITLVLGYIPFWEGLATLRPLFTGPAVERYTNSLGDQILYTASKAASGFAALLDWQPAGSWTIDAIMRKLDWPVRFGAVLIVAAVAITQSWKARTFNAMVVAWGWLLFAYLTVGSVWFWPWYVSWLVPVIALLGPGTLFNASLILSISSMLLYATYWRSNSAITELETGRSIIMEGTPLLYLGVTAYMERRSRRRPKPSWNKEHEVLRRE